MGQHQGGEHRLTYSSYLKVPELLRLQQLQAEPQRHDELLFIVIHQTYELWFKELLHDLDAVVALFAIGGAQSRSARRGLRGRPPVAALY